MIASTAPAVLAAYPVNAAPLWVDALAALAGGIGIAAQWPQAWRLWWSRQYAGLSTLSCVLNVLTPVCWFAYGLVQGSVVQIALNGTAIVGSVGVLLGLVVRARLRAREWLPPLLGGAAAIATVALVGGAPAAGALASVVTLSMALPQVALLLRGRLRGGLDTSGVSRPRWAMSTACNVGWFSYAFLVADPAIGFTSGAMVVSSVLVLVLCRPVAQVAPVVAPVLRLVPAAVDLPAGGSSGAVPADPSGGALPTERIACSP
jgi:uncharacterized protein with PQ loop repeat